MGCPHVKRKMKQNLADESIKKWMWTGTNIKTDSGSRKGPKQGFKRDLLFYLNHKFTSIFFSCDHELMPVGSFTKNSLHSRIVSSFIIHVFVTCSIMYWVDAIKFLESTKYPFVCLFAKEKILAKSLLPLKNVRFSMFSLNEKVITGLCVFSRCKIMLATT